MLGAIAGDVIGSVYEGSPIKTTDFPLFAAQSRFTDDTVLTVAVADAILEQAEQASDEPAHYADKFRDYFALYPNAGYGGSFFQWAAARRTQPYASWGNGSAMRVSPVGLAYDSLDTVLREAQRSADVTHNHPEGIKGAQATACAVFLAHTGRSKAEIKTYLETIFQYNLSEPLDAIRPTYTFDVSCQGSVPQAISAFLESHSYEDAVRKAISLGGDSDTQACIAGGIAEAFYGGIPSAIATKVWHDILDERLRSVIERFRARYLGTSTQP